MRRKTGPILLAAGIAFFIMLLFGGEAIGLYTDALWYDGIGYFSVFQSRLTYAVVVQLAAGVLVAGIVLLNMWLVLRYMGPVRLRRRYGNIEIAEQVPRRFLVLAIIGIALLAGWWIAALQYGGGGWMTVMSWLRGVSWGVTEPVFNSDLSYYVFALPAYFSFIDLLLITLLWSAALVVVGYVLIGSVGWENNQLHLDPRAARHASILGAAVILLFGLRYWLGRYNLLVDGNGIGGGLGYTDMNVRLPAHAILALLSVGVAGAVVYGAWKRNWVPPVIGVGLLLAGAVLVGRLYPAVIQRFRVEPNELALETRFIEWNIDYTRRAYDLAGVDGRPFPYNADPVGSWEELEPELGRLPLWDSEPLRTAYNQVQSIFGYYGFSDVDFDRYPTTDGPVQVALSVREFVADGLPEGSQTWQTLRLNPKYLHGNGAVVTPTGRTGSFGEPVLWLSNVDPTVLAAAAPSSLELDKPAVFFGESSAGYALLIPGRDGAFTGEPGVDFPSGVRLGSLTRLLAFAWRFGDKNLLFSGQLTDSTRIIFRRSLQERLSTLAPFILWDPNAYPVVLDGRIMWIVDGYTATARYPLSHPIALGGVGQLNYLRNSVKAVVDAVTGDVRLYAVGGRDPLLATYRRVFPELFVSGDRMPDALRAHLRYPALYLRVQADILEAYHLTRPEIFYAGQDVWELPAAVAPGREMGAYRPLYALYPLPGAAEPEFLVSIPFVARGRQNMTALLIARNDPPNYGELILLELPRDEQIPGPVQVQTLMEQDPVISEQLSLWRRSGSNVTLGRLRIVPLDSAFLYVEPLYLAAGEGAAIPELQRVVVSDGERMAMASTFPGAIGRIHGETRGILAANRGQRARPEMDADDDAMPAPDTVVTALPTDLPDRALELMREAEARLRAGDWAGFGQKWNELRALLERIESGG